MAVTIEQIHDEMQWCVERKEEMKVFVFILVHVIGTISSLIIHYYNGTFEWSSKNGDGIRSAKPTDIVFYDLILWEIQLLIFVLDEIEELINDFFEKRFRCMKNKDKQVESFGNGYEK